MNLTRAQQMMVADGMPAELIFTDEERRQHWKGVKLSRQGARFGRLDAAEERQRNKLHREYEREQARKKRERLEQFLESRRG